MPDDLNPDLAGLLAGAADDEAGPEPHDEASPHRRYGASPPPAARCEECQDDLGQGNCPACLAIRAAAHQRSPEEQIRYDKAKRTRPIDAGMVAGRRERLAGGKGANMPKVKLPHIPLRDIPPRPDPAAGGGRCPNPRGNPKCRGTCTASKPLCMSCAMREAHAKRCGEAPVTAPASTPPGVVDLRARRPVPALASGIMTTASPVVIAVADFTIRARIEVHPETGKLEIHGDLVGPQGQ